MFKEKKTTNYTQEQIEILKIFNADKKAQECLRLYRLLPENEKNNMLQAMDSFLRGFSEGQNTLR